MLNFIKELFSEEKKGLTESELKTLRARFKRRQKKFSTITYELNKI